MLQSHSCIEFQVRTKQRHREHSKKHNQALKESIVQGKSSEVAKQTAKDAARSRVFAY
jgi:hypothetical protein